MRSEDVAAIRELPLFRNVGQATFEVLVETGFLQQFPPGVVLVQERDPADFLHVVVDGLVEMFAATAGRETTIELIRPVGLFVLAAVLNDQAYLQSARTLERSRILMIPASKVRAGMEQDPAFMRAVVQELARGYRRAVKHLKEQKLRSGAERLANWLLRAQREQGGATRIGIPFEKRVLASWLGMTPENLSRAFANLRSCGVTVRGATVEITRPTALADLARPDPLIDAPEG